MCPDERKAPLDVESFSEVYETTDPGRLSSAHRGSNPNSDSTPDSFSARHVSVHACVAIENLAEHELKHQKKENIHNVSIIQT